MHRLFGSLIAPLIEALEPRTIVEIGAGSGRLTKKLLGAPGASGATIHAVDPVLALDPALVDGAGERLRIHRDRAVEVIDGIEAADLAILDGDPNWHATRSEMTLLIDAAKRAGRPAPLLAVHHVHWPFGRRDGYHDPSVIPEAYRHRYTDLGLVPHSREPTPKGLRLTPYCAARGFGPRSGVLTGVKDAIADSDLEWTMVELPGFNGCAVLAEAALLEERPALGDVIERFRGAAFNAQQARRAETARLAAEVEQAAPRGEADGDTPSLEAEEQVVEKASPEAVPAEHDDRLARETARRESVEWRLQRVDEDLARMQARLDAVQKERDEAVASSAETRVRLERVGEDLAARQHELDEALEREKLLSGRLSLSEDTLQGAVAELERMRKHTGRLKGGLANARALLNEVSQQVELAQSRPGARFARRLRRAGRAISGRGSSPVKGPLDRLRELSELARGSLYVPADPPVEGAERVEPTASGEGPPSRVTEGAAS